MGKKLVLFFSHTGENYFGGQIRRIEKGNTAIAAEMVADAANADLFEIVPAEPYPENYQECVDRSRKELHENARPAVVKLPELADYETVYLGYPNWCGTIPMPVATVLENCDFAGKTVHPFCTNEGSGMGTSEHDLKRLAQDATIAPGLSINGSAVASAGKRIADWISASE